MGKLISRPAVLTEDCFVTLPGKPARLVHVNFLPVESSNVDWVGWDVYGNMYVKFLHTGSIYVYFGVSRQKAVAAAYAKSVGGFINRRIKGHYPAMRLAA